MNYKIRMNKGFTFVETLVGLAVFTFVVFGVYESYSVLVKSAKASRLKVAATMIANEQIELIRNLTYGEVGTVGGIPSGVIQSDRVIVRDGASFNVKTTIRNIDDSFDGTLGGSPNDLSPADYKLVDITVSCPTCGAFTDVELTTNIAPKNLEVSSSNGALFVNVYDALGQIVSGANVNIINNSVNPQINLSDITGSNGSLQLVDVPVSSQSYQIEISKDGYSTDKTYPITLLNPNPTKPYATVASNQLTQISFSIDKLSSLNVSTVTSSCTTTPNIGFYMTSSKLIGTDPEIPKNNNYYTTDSSGLKNMTGVEWDSYNFSIPNTSTSTHFLAGTLPMTPMVILPDSSFNITLITKSKNPNALLVSIRDVGTKLPITGASVELTNGTIMRNLVTGRGSEGQFDWSGGSGQNDFIDEEKYYYSENINTNDGIRLASVLGEYESSGYLESSTFDTGSASNFYNISWGPIDQPPASGVDSVKFQIATNNNKSNWVFLGPDGTSGTYYTSSGSTINPSHNGDRYLRYKAYLNTEASTSTPNISNVSFSYTSACMPSGQVFFDGLTSDTYELRITKDGYSDYVNELVPVTSSWQEQTVNMSPL